jgi:hypothetical protein
MKYIAFTYYELGFGLVICIGYCASKRPCIKKWLQLIWPTIMINPLDDIQIISLLLIGQLHNLSPYNVQFFMLMGEDEQTINTLC